MERIRIEIADASHADAREAGVARASGEIDDIHRASVVSHNNTNLERSGLPPFLKQSWRRVFGGMPFQSMSEAKSFRETRLA